MIHRSHPPSHSPATAVVGLQFGDEGKGQVVDFLTRDHDVVVRANGGANAGHTVRVGAGPFPTEIEGPEADRLRERGREYGTTTGRPRRIGTLDLEAVARAVRIGGVTEIALTGAGVLHDDPIREAAPLIERIEAAAAPVTLLATGPAREELIELRPSASRRS